MGVDTAIKRKAMLSFGSGDLLCTPTGTVDAAARAQLLEGYGGNAWSAPSSAVAAVYDDTNVVLSERDPMIVLLDRDPNVVLRESDPMITIQVR